MNESSSEILIAHDDVIFRKEAAQLILKTALDSVAERGQFCIVLSGGNTPKKIFELLTEPYYKQRMPWNKCYFFWGDERCVPPDHEDSNYRMAMESFLKKLSIPSTRIFRMAGEMDPPRAAATAYQNTLRTFYKIDKSLPRFDLMLLGMGEDGHTASLFPGTTALNESEHWVAANFIEKLSTSRITLTLPVINNARKIVILCSGKAKAKVVRDIFRDDIDYRRYPVQRVRPNNGALIWLLNPEAASLLAASVSNNAKHI